MRRREFITFVGGTAATMRFAAAQQKLRHVAVQMAPSETDHEGRAWLDAFVNGLAKLGWIEGQNLQIDIRWAGGSAERARQIAAEFVSLRPDVIVANGTLGMTAIKKTVSTIPVVFTVVNEPVAQGFIASMDRHGGKVTGFTMMDFPLIGKQVQLLKTVSPTTKRVGLMFNPEGFPYYD